MSRELLLISSAGFSILVLIVLIARLKLNSFVALIIASLLAGILAGMKLGDIAKAFGEGVGAVLSSIAMVVGLGAVLGKMLQESGGAEVIAGTITKRFGDRFLPWAVVIIALIVGLPVFFPVGVVLLTPIVIGVARRSGASFLQLGLPMMAGLSAAHGLIPPHPGPLVAIQTLHADPGRTILYSLIIAIPAAFVAGPVFTKWILRRVESPALPESRSVAGPKSLPSFGISLFTVALPIFLMLLSSAGDLVLAKESSERSIANFIGNPLCALTISVLVSFYTFGIRRGFTRQEILQFSDSCLGPTAVVLLVVGAGGGFNRILVASGVGDVLGHAVENSRLSPIFLGWTIAALIRIATGSATVAISTAAGLLAPVVATHPVNLELLVVAMGSGSLIASHLNDGGFWIVKEFLHLSVPQTLRTWTVIETIIAFLGLVGALALSQIFKV